MTKMTARMWPPAALGTLLLMVSGALLAADVAITRTLATDEPSLAENAAATTGTYDTVSPQATCAVSHTCEMIVAHHPAATARAAFTSHALAHTSHALAHNSHALAQTSHALAQTSSLTHAPASPTLTASVLPPAINVRLPLPPRAPFVTAVRHVVPASLSEKTQSANAQNAHDASRDERLTASVSSPAHAVASVSHAPDAVREVARQPAPAARRSAANSAALAPVQRSAVQRARLAVIQMVKAQTPGIQWISAGAHKKDRDRLVVRVVAHTKTATFYEYDVLRQNGIGFAVEQRKFRTVVRDHASRVSRDPGP